MTIARFFFFFLNVYFKGGMIRSTGNGGLFGNISKKSFSLSSITVTAATNVDILQLNSQIFFKYLEVIVN